MNNMNVINKLSTFIFISLLFFACETDEDKLYNLDYISAPGNISAVFDVTQDNTGLVSITPNADGAQQFIVDFGDSSETEESTVGETIEHIYSEGVYDVTIQAVGLTGLTTKYTQELNVSFKAPENVEVSIVNDEVNPKIVSVTATGDFATVFEVYFGDVENEEATLALPEETVTHTYENTGDYEITVIAKSAGAATTTYTEIINVPEATDPVSLPIDFESFTINYAFTDFGNVGSSVVDNPDASGINTSDKVALSAKPSGAETWGGTYLTLGSTIDFSTNTTFKVKVWSPKADAVVKLKVENLNDGNIAHEVDATTTLSEEWEELSFDFSGIDTNNEYQKVVLFFDFGNTGDDSNYYFDDVKLTAAQIPTYSIFQDLEGIAPEFTVFGNIAGIEVVSNPDATGENTTSAVAQFTKTSGAETWAGAYFEVSSALDFDTYSSISVKTWSPKSGITVKVKLENSDASVTYEVDATTTVANAWEELVYDFSSADAADYVRVVIFFDFGNSGDGSVFYFDEFALANEEGSVAPLAVEDFEGTAPAFTDFGSATTTVISNPDASGVNTSAYVAQQTKASGAETWAGTWFDTGAALDFSTYTKVSLKVWSPKSGITVKFKVENRDDGNISYEVDATTSVANAWEELSFDFSEIDTSSDYHNVVVFFDFGNAGDDSVYYFDDIELTN